jgi:hypothetical protein
MTYNALKEEIKLWENNLKAQSPEYATCEDSDSPLCETYADADCKDCPVAFHTGKPWCEDTPMKAAIDAHADWASLDEHEDDAVAVVVNWQKQAHASIDFLTHLDSVMSGKLDDSVNSTRKKVGGSTGNLLRALADDPVVMQDILHACRVEGTIIDDETESKEGEYLIKVIIQRLAEIVK